MSRRSRYVMALLAGCLFLGEVTGMAQVDRPVVDPTAVTPVPPEDQFTRRAHPITGVTTAKLGVFRISGVRPLEIASELLKRKLGVPISYEGITWASREDLRSGTLDVVVPTSPLAARPADIIRQAVASHASFRGPGGFNLVGFGESEFSIVPANPSQTDGRNLGYASPLDVSISFPPEDRSLGQTLELILRTINEAARGPFTGRHTFTGQEQYAWEGPKFLRPQELLYHHAHRVRVGANAERARDVLARALRIPGEIKFTWDMRYDPLYKNYTLNFQPLAEEVLTSTGEARLRRIYWPPE